MAKEPDPVDVYVGSRVRQRRQVLGLSQEKLGDALGLTFQQIQKYERGMNRMGSSRLYRIAQFLDVPISHFFEGFEGKVVTPELSEKESSNATAVDQLTDREKSDLLRSYAQIENEGVRRRVRQLLKSLGGHDEE